MVTVCSTLCYLNLHAFGAVAGAVVCLTAEFEGGVVGVVSGVDVQCGVFKLWKVRYSCGCSLMHQNLSFNSAGVVRVGGALRCSEIW